MLIAALSAIFAVGLIGTSMLIASSASGGVSHNSALFKTGNPTLAGESVILGISKEINVDPSPLDTPPSTRTDDDRERAS